MDQIPFLSFSAIRQNSDRENSSGENIDYIQSRFLKNCVAPNPLKYVKVTFSVVFQPPVIFIGNSHNVVHKDKAHKGYK